MTRRGLAALDGSRRRTRRRLRLWTIVLLGGVGASLWGGWPDGDLEDWPSRLQEMWAIGTRDSTEATGANLPVAIPAPGQRVRVEVLNAGGVPGMAAEARDRLRDVGFDVVYYGNASRFGEETSVVLHRSGERAFAEAVARALGIAEVQTQLDPSLLLEVTVRLGVNWAEERDHSARAVDSEDRQLHPEEEG